MNQLSDSHKFSDIKDLVFEGFLKETIKFNDLVVVIRTLGVAEESQVIETYENLPNEYNLLAAADTVQCAIYSINGCKITDDVKKLVRNWPKQIIIKIFEVYLTLASRVREATKLINEFIKTDESKLRWTVIKTTKTSLNSVTITGNSELESKGISYIQQIWIYLNQQNDLIERNTLDWAKVEYMTDSICTFVNPKAMQQIQGKKKLQQEEQMMKEQREEVAKIQTDSKEKLMIENSADELFDALTRKPGESMLDYQKRVGQSVAKAFTEDEHDKIVREWEEYQFTKQLRIKKENTRRAKILHENKMTNAIVIDVPRAAPQSIIVGFSQVSNIGDDIVDVQEEKGPWIVNNIDYSEIVSITSFSMLKNRDQIFKEITSESEEETIKWIEEYLQEEAQTKSDVVAAIESLTKTPSMEKPIDGRDKILSARERVLSAGKKTNKFENEQQEMIDQIQKSR